MTDSEIENIQQMQQEIERLRNENAHLRRELYPPDAEKKELKYWIVTWLDEHQAPQAMAFTIWSAVPQLQEGLKRANCTHINILEQRVLL